MGYNLVTDVSNFKPFTSFKEMALPMMDYLERVDKTRELLDKYLDEYGDIIVPEDSKYKGIMDEYNQLLKSLADNIYNQPIELVKNYAHNIRNKYKSLILPIKTMMLEYNKDIDKVNTALMSNSNLYLGSPVNYLDYYGNNLPLIKLLNSKLILDEAKNIVSSISSLSTVKPEIVTTIANLFYVLKNLGSDSDEIMLAIRSIGDLGGISKEDSISIALLLDSLYNKYSEGCSDEAKSKIIADIKLGAILGMIPTTYSYLNYTQPHVYHTPTSLLPYDYAASRGYQKVDDVYYRHILDDTGTPTGDFERDNEGNIVIYEYPGVKKTERVTEPKGIKLQVDGLNYYLLQNGDNVMITDKEGYLIGSFRNIGKNANISEMARDKIRSINLTDEANKNDSPLESGNSGNGGTNNSTPRGGSGRLAKK